MPQGPSVVVDGKRYQIHYFTGRVLSSQKQKETQVSSRTLGTQANSQVHVTSTTVDHHEFFLVDEAGKERSFKMVNFDFPCREGQTLSVVWAIAEDAESGPYVQVRNHSTDELHQEQPNEIASWFKKPGWMIWGSTAALVLVVGAVINWILGMFAILGPPLYFRSRSRKAAKTLLASDALRQLDSELARKPAVAA
jgi:hypothetical protein